MKRAALLLVLLLAACDENMDEQNRMKTYAAADTAHWPAQSEALRPPEGTVSRDDVARDSEIAAPPAMSQALLQRGRQRYNIYCAACHGLTGAGDGIVVARGFPAPKPFDDPKLLEAPAAHLVDVIGHGYGRMYAFADRVEPTDRWAIAAYIRALQLAGTAGKASP